MRNRSKLIASVTVFLCPISFAFSANITDYASLQAAIAGADPSLNIVDSPISWPPNNSRLFINYPVTFTAGGGLSQAVFNGVSNSPPSPLFGINAPGSAAWNGNFLFSQGSAPTSVSGGAIQANNVVLTFIGDSTFANNGGISGGALFANGGMATFYGNTTFINNASRGTPGGAAIHVINNNVLTFNGTTTFMGNVTASAGQGGGIHAASATVIFNGSGTFSGNRTPGGFGGGIYATNAVITINDADPSMPFLFINNAPQDIYLNNNAQLNLNPSSDVIISMQTGVASANALGNIITLQGPGTWQMGGNSTGYQGTTNINAGTFELQPGAVYGTPASGTVTIGPGGTLAYNVEGGGTFPLLQGATINLNGSVVVLGFPGSSIDAPITTMGTVAQAGTSLLVNGAAFAPGEMLAQGSDLLYDWQLVFASPTQLNLLITDTRTIEDVVIDAGGNRNNQDIANALDDFSLSTPGLLADYIQAIINASSSQEALDLIDALQGEPLTGSYELLLNQLINFTIQVDERLNSPVDTAKETAMNPQGRIVLASVDKALPFSSSARTPWVGWGQILGGLGRQNAVNGSNAYDSHNGGLTAGFDRALDRNWRLGAAINYQRGILDWDKYNAETRSNTLGGVLYGSYDRDSWFARSQVGGGGSWVKTQRDIPLTVLGLPPVTASSDPTLPFIQARASSGYHFYYNDVRFTPSAGLFYVHTISDPYSESGADQLSLRVDRSDQDNLEAQANLELSYVAKINDRPITLRANYGLGYETLDKQVTITTGFLAFPNLITFDASAVSPSRLRQIAELGMIVNVAKNVQFRLDYVGVFARHQYNNTGAVGVKVVF